MRLPPSLLCLLVATVSMGTVVSAGTVGDVTAFVLIDACSDTDIGLITEGDEIDLAETGSCLNIRAETSGQVESVRFGLDGDADYRVESAPPYALEGDSNGDYNEWTPAVGAHSISGTPYSADGAGGEEGATLTVGFTVVDEGIEFPPPTGGTGSVSGTLQTWHGVTVDFSGPATSESDPVNPFRTYRLNVTFTHAASATTIVVPGFYATDGEAAETSASAGTIWRVHLAPPLEGVWNYVASFRGGTDIAISNDPEAGVATWFDGASGSFSIGPSSASSPDLRAEGLLEYVDERYLRFADSGRYFLKGGADSPENLLGYAEFDDTVDNGGSANDLPDGLHHFLPHVADWSPGDPVWQSDRGKGLIGALNYLSSKGMNSVYFLTMNVGGDGREVYPWTAYSERYRFDVSKLAQWEIVFTHMDRVGLMLHVVTQETENDQLLDGGALGTQRRLYYREIVARFGHHLAVVWNLGEENTNSDGQRKAFADLFKLLDPYDHQVVVHTFPGDYDDVYTPLLAYPTFDGPSLQLGNMNGTHDETITWVDASTTAGRPWIVSLDEIGPAGDGVLPDADDFFHDAVRRHALWGNLMAGGAGCEWYMGYQYPDNDLDCEDWRSRDRMWEQTRHALDFFELHLPFPLMYHADDLTPAGDDFCFALAGSQYAVYVPSALTSPQIDLSGATGSFVVRWYDPRNGGSLQVGSVPDVAGGQLVDLGEPPDSSDEDWVVLVSSQAGQPIFGDDFESGDTSAWSTTVP